MVDIDVASVTLAELEALNRAKRAGRWELWVSFAAALLVMLVVSGVLMVLTAELRAGWVPGHELPMDKAAAIHKLLFRE